jgi:hypothetical protein
VRASTVLDLVYVALEAAVDAFCGRPREANPYSREYARDDYEMWDLAWVEARELLELRGEEEAARWLREAA